MSSHLPAVPALSMSNGAPARGRRRCALLALLTLVLSAPSTAAEKYGNALDWVPADAAVFSCSMRMKEQIDIIAASNAWKKFREIPTVAMVWQMAEGQINDQSGPASMFLPLLDLPENQQLVQMLGDMFSQEIVVYGGPKTVACLELYQSLSGANTFAKLEAGPGNGDGRRDAQARGMLQALQENRALLKTPDLVFAFKLADKAAAQTQLKRLEVLTKMAMKQTPFPDRLKREKIGDAEFLTLNLDGSLVPWDQVPWDQYEEEEGEFKELRASLEKMKLVVSLGVRGDYLLLSIDESTDRLAKLGQGKVLADVKEFAPLAKFRDRKLSSIQYISEALAKRTQMSSTDIDQLVEQVGGILDAAGVDDEKLKDRITADVEKLGGDLKEFIPKPGALMSFAFMTPTGFEGYTHNWTQSVAIDGSQPLPLANHVGGDPVLAIVGRGKYDPQAYDKLVKWAKVGFSYFEDFALPQMGGDDREKATQALEIAKPLLERADKVTRDLLVPAFKDGQSAFVMAAQISSKQWHKEMPASAHALPMVELALVMGVSDVESFKNAMSEYKIIANDLVNKIREKDATAIPADYQVPSPESETTKGGTVYHYKLPAEAGLDPQVALSGGVGEKLAVFATSPRLVAKILAETPLASQTLIGSAATKPCATLVYFHWPALVDAATPWIEFAIRENGPGAAGAEAEEDPAQIADILSQVRTVLEILKCWRTTESVTTIEDGVTVSHSVTTFKDLE